MGNPWIICRTLEGSDCVTWVHKVGIPGTVRYTPDKWGASRYSDEDKEQAGEIPGHTWVKLNLKIEVTFDDIREYLGACETWAWSHTYKVIEVIEAKMANDLVYAHTVRQWLEGPNSSTVWLRDEVMEPLRNHPELVAIGRKFNPSTEWHNTWMPLDTLIHCVRNGIKPGE